MLIGHKINGGYWLVTGFLIYDIVAFFHYMIFISFVGAFFQYMIFLKKFEVLSVVSVSDCEPN